MSHLSFHEIPRSRPRVLHELEGTLPDTATVQAMSCFYPVLGYRREKILIDRETTRVTADYAVLRTERTTWPLRPVEARALVYTALASGKYENRSTVPGFYILCRIRPAPRR